MKRSLPDFPFSILVGWVVFVLVASLVAMGLSIGGLQPGSAAVGLIVGGVAAFFAVWQTRLEREQSAHERWWFWRYAVWICFALFAFRAFLWLIFLKNGQVAVLSPNNLGDLPLHLQYIRFFSQGAPLWPVNPIHAHSTIGYPFAVDYFNAILDVCGIPLWNSLLCTGLAGALITGIALYRWGGAFGMAGFLFNGGAAGLAIFTSGKWEDYQAAMDWKSIPLALFVTQRGFLYALPAGLLLLVHWRRMQEPERPKMLPFWLELLVYATMPLFHIHTFLFLSVVIAALALFGQARRHFWILTGAALLPASGLMYLLTDGFHAGDSFGWLPGWMQGPQFSWAYWVKNFGVFPIFALGLLGWLVVQRKTTELIFVGAAVFLFTTTLLFKFSPWAWDNTKLMMWSYLLLLPYLWRALVERTHPLVCGGVCLLLFFSGFVSLWGGLGADQTGHEIADQHTALAVGEAVAGIPILEKFASAPDFAHPLVLSGRCLALAYHGHMIGHGLPYLEEKNAMDRLMTGSATWERDAEWLGLRYLFWGPSEERLWPQSDKPWISASELTASGSWGQIYKIR